jgi:hypothetical protein
MAVRHIRGDTWRRAWVIKDSLGAPIDLTGAVPWLHLRDAAEALVLEATLANGRLTLTPAAGRVDLSMEAAVMWLDPGRYPYDMQITDATGVVRTVEQGTLVIVKDVTHA